MISGTDLDEQNIAVPCFKAVN